MAAKFSENFFGLSYTSITNVRSNVFYLKLFGYFFGWWVGRGGIRIDNKANSVQFKFELPTGTELGNLQLN
jgi:hypothetical protein